MLIILAWAGILGPQRTMAAPPVVVQRNGLAQAQPVQAPPVAGQPGQAGTPGTPTAPEAQPGTPGAPAQPSATPPSPPRPQDPENLPQRRDQLVSMSFENADISSVLRALAEIWGETLTVHPDLKGTITVLSANEVTIPESFEIMRSAMNVRGYTMVGTLDDDKKVLEIWPRDKVLGQGGSVQVGSDPDQLDEDAKIVTQVAPLRFLKAKNIANSLQPLITKDNASLVPLEDSNTLIITDTMANVKRLLTIIKALDDAPADQRKVDVVPLENANAEDIQQLLMSIYSDPLGNLSNQLSGRNQQQQQVVVQMLQAGLIDPNAGVKVTADTRTNALVLYGEPDRLDQLKLVIKQLDRNITEQVVFRRFQLQYAEATSVAQDLGTMIQQPEGTGQRVPSFVSFYRRRSSSSTEGRPGFTKLKENLVVPDVRTNALLVTATPENMLIFEDLIRAFDQPSELQEIVEVIPLEFAQASNVQTTIQRLLSGARSSSRGFFFFLFGDSRSTNSPLQQLQNVAVVADRDSNAMIISGPVETLPTVRRIINMLDQPQAQVYISVIIADVTLRDDQQLGVEMSWMRAPTARDTATTTFDIDNQITQGIRYALVEDEFQGLLRALSDNNKVKVLSTPHITTLDNVRATISIGEKYPIQTQSETSGGALVTQTTFEDIAIRLDVTPRVSLGSQMVVLDVSQSIDEVTGTVRQGNFDLPIISTRNADTQVMVQTGQTVVIGGIIRDRDEERKVGVPLLQDIPFLGALFQRTQHKSERTELMVFLTPFVVTTDEQLDRIRSQRQKELSGRFPQVDDYLRSQEGYRDEALPKAVEPAPEPQPTPRSEPTPELMGPGNGTPQALGPVAPGRTKTALAPLGPPRGGAEAKGPVAAEQPQQLGPSRSEEEALGQ